MSKNENRPPYADYPTIEKFMAIESIIAKRLKEHPKAICSYSGGSDSDILIDLIERVRKMFGLDPVAYEFFNTGLEMKAIKNHVKEAARKYGVEITEYRPAVNIVNAVRQYGVPFLSKAISRSMWDVQRHGIPFSIVDEFENAGDKFEKTMELRERYRGGVDGVRFLCSVNAKTGEAERTQFTINGRPYLLDFMREFPPTFKISARCCDYCKKNVAHMAQKNFEMVITGERGSERGVRTLSHLRDTKTLSPCFREYGENKWRLRPLFYVTDEDKAWYKQYYGIRYSDAYEVYGLKRTGCCGCPISGNALPDLELIRPYEPSLVKAAWNVFGDSYRYRQKYNEYKKGRMEKEKDPDEQIDGQMSLSDYEGVVP